MDFCSYFVFVTSPTFFNLLTEEIYCEARVRAATTAQAQEGDDEFQRFPMEKLIKIGKAKGKVWKARGSIFGYWVSQAEKPGTEQRLLKGRISLFFLYCETKILTAVITTVIPRSHSGRHHVCPSHSWGSIHQSLRLHNLRRQDWLNRTWSAERPGIWSSKVSRVVCIAFCGGWSRFHRQLMLFRLDLNLRGTIRQREARAQPRRPCKSKKLEQNLDCQSYKRHTR